MSSSPSRIQRKTEDHILQIGAATSFYGNLIRQIPTTTTQVEMAV